MSRCPNMPKDWQPPAPAWRCAFGAAKGVFFAHFGSQANHESRTRLDDWLDLRAGDIDAPARIDRALYRDEAGKHCRLALCYWLDRSVAVRWIAGGAAWWDDPARLCEGVGYFREVYDVPVDRIETIWSSPEAHAIGVRDLLPVDGPMREHAYWGAARDRLKVSDTNDLTSPLGQRFTLSTDATEGRRIDIRPPENLCIIRSGQDWSRCNAGEAESYFTTVEPALRLGMAFLSAERAQTGCVDCRFASEIDANGEKLGRSFGLAQFVTLRHLEDWSRSHETHLAIFDRFMAMLAAHDFDVSLHLYHELFVTSRDNPLFTYINCHNRTGLLAIGEAERGRHAAMTGNKQGTER